MKFYSEVLEKVFNTQEELERAEKHFAQNQNQKENDNKEKRIQELKEKKKGLSQEIEKMLDELTAKMESIDCINEELKKIETKDEDDFFSAFLRAILG